MCNNPSRNLSVTVDTSDVVALLEVGRMFASIADARVDARAAVAAAMVAPYGRELTEAEATTVMAERVNPAADAFKEVEDGARVDPGAAFAHTSTPAGPAATLAAISAPQAPSTPPAPAAPAAQPGAELDKNGLPWDARINTSNKAQTKQGVWKRAPGLTDELYNQVIAELKGVMNGAPSQPASTLPQAPSTPPNPATPAAPAAPVTPEEEAVPTDLPGILTAVSKRTMCNPPKLTQPEIQTALQVVGAMNGCTLNSLADLNARADLIPAVYNQLAAAWAGR